VEYELPTGIRQDGIMKFENKSESYVVIVMLVNICYKNYHNRSCVVFRVIFYTYPIGCGGQTELLSVCDNKLCIV
jgi:hypothetical protein